jgi:predicted enzyme related to lactoylglutathione lyase
VGQPVVHFEVVGRDQQKLSEYYSQLFGWEISAASGAPLPYGVVDREGNTNRDGVGIGGGIGQAPDEYSGHVTFYVEVPDVEAALANAEALGGTRLMGPDVAGPVEIGLFQDPEGHTIGVVKGGS